MANLLKWAARPPNWRGAVPTDFGATLLTCRLEVSSHINPDEQALLSDRTFRMDCWVKPGNDEIIPALMVSA
jgi:hypothetical protein